MSMNPQKPSLMQNMNVSRKKTFGKPASKSILDLANMTGIPRMPPIPKKVPLSEVSVDPIPKVSEKVVTPTTLPSTRFNPFFMSQKDEMDGSIYYDGGHIRLIYEDGGPDVFDYDSLYFSFPSENAAKSAQLWVSNQTKDQTKKVHFNEFKSEFQQKGYCIEIPKVKLQEPIAGIFFELIVNGNNIIGSHVSRGGVVPIAPDFKYEKMDELYDTVKNIDWFTNEIIKQFMNSGLTLSNVLESLKLMYEKKSPLIAKLFEFAIPFFTDDMITKLIKRFFPENHFIGEISKIKDQFPSLEQQQLPECQLALHTFLTSDFFVGYPTLDGIFQINDLTDPQKFIDDHINIAYFCRIDSAMQENSIYFMRVIGYFKNQLLQATHLLQDMGLNPMHIAE